MVWNDKVLSGLPFSKRLEYFDRAEKQFPILKQKPFIRLTQDFRDEIRALKNSKKPYETDGIILTPSDGLYEEMQVYKYKPIDKLSIDFLIKRCPQNLLGIHPYIPQGKTLYILYCGISKNVFHNLGMSLIKYYDETFKNINIRELPNYFPIQFSPSNKQYAYLYHSADDNLDGQVGEFRFNTADNIWELIKLRADRLIEVERGVYFGNNYKIAELTWMSYFNPLVIEDLAETNYFQVADNTLHKASRSFNSFVKSQIFETFQETEWVMDLASGKGQDLFRYATNHMQNVLFLEIDDAALLELIQRKHDFGNKGIGMKFQPRNSQNTRNTTNKAYNTTNDSHAMRIYLQQMDLLTDYKENIEQLEHSQLEIPSHGFGLIICNFALHYLIKSATTTTNIIKFINHYLKPGGRFIFTAFDGSEIVELLARNNGEWKSTKPDKFSIKKQYTEDILQPVGQKISVLLPFSRDEYYDEYLVNIDYLEKEFAKYNISLEIDQSFSEYLEEYQRTQPKQFAEMDADDKLYTQLYHYYSFYKSIPKPATKSKH